MRREPATICAAATRYAAAAQSPGTVARSAGHAPPHPAGPTRTTGPIARNRSLERGQHALDVVGRDARLAEDGRAVGVETGEQERAFRPRVGDLARMLSGDSSRPSASGPIASGTRAALARGESLDSTMAPRARSGATSDVRSAPARAPLPVTLDAKRCPRGRRRAGSPPRRSRRSRAGRPERANRGGRPRR